AAEHALGTDGPDLIQLRLTNMDDAPQISKALEASLGGGYQVQDWLQLNGQLYSALWLEKISISLTIGLIVMGAAARAIRRIFVLQGLTIGLVGTTLGASLGVAVCLVADRYRLIKLPSDVYQITYLPFHVGVLDT